MKKRDTMLLLFSASLLLSACGGGNSQSNNSQNSGSDSPSESESTGQKESMDSQIDNSNESGSNANSSSSSEETSIDYTIGWSEEVLDVMEPHLGGHAIPFIDLPGRILATWMESTYDYYSSTSTPSYLSIISTGGFDSALAGAAKMTYQKAGWNVEFDKSTLKMHAEEETLGITVDFYGVYDPNDKMTNPQVDVFYVEPFLVPDKGAWRNATLDALETIGVEAPHGLPYVYMGTLAEEASLSGDYVDIQGLKGGWNQYQNEILAAARAALPRSKKWVESTERITIGSGYYSESVNGYAFTKSFSDGYTVKAILYYKNTSSSYYNTENTPFLRVSATHN